MQTHGLVGRSSGAAAVLSVPSAAAASAAGLTLGGMTPPLSGRTPTLGGMGSASLHPPGSGRPLLQPYSGVGVGGSHVPLVSAPNLGLDALTSLLDQSQPTSGAWNTQIHSGNNMVRLL